MSTVRNITAMNAKDAMIQSCTEAQKGWVEEIEKGEPSRIAGPDGYEIYGFSFGDVTMLAWYHKYDQSWIVKTVCW